MYDRRIISGFAQYRDGGRWRYRVIGFDAQGQRDLCNVEGAAGERVACQIDARNRVRIGGRWVTPAGWFH